jgi:hypothetical protein
MLIWIVGVKSVYFFKNPFNIRLPGGVLRKDRIIIPD